MKKKRIFIIDVQPIFRLGIRQLISGCQDFQVVGEAQSGRAALDMAPPARPDIFTIDIHLPDMNGAVLILDLRRILPESSILVVSRNTDIGYITRSIQCGADGYVAKESSVDLFVEALSEVSAGREYVDKAIKDKVALKLRRTATARQGAAIRARDRLSQKEQDIIKGLVNGKSPRQIGAKMNLKQKTIENYRARIMKKLNLRSGIDLVKYAVRTGLVDLDKWRR